MAELASGRTLHRRFTLIRRLGAGGMGEVWLVRDEELDERVAAKIVPADGDARRTALLRRECRQARRLAHPHIVPVFDFHRGRRFHLITMEHIEGRDAGHLRGAPPAEIVRLLLPIADALAHAHSMGVVHRDLKVAHVLVDSAGRPRLVDFGIAGLLRSGDDLELHGGGSRLRASPQQLGGARPSPADDLYAFGVLLHELLTGAPPPGSEGGPPPSVRRRHPVPEALRQLVTRLLAEDPAERPPDMLSVRRALEEIERGLAPAESRQETPPPVRLTPPPRIGELRPGAQSASGPAGRSTPGRRPARRWVSLVTPVIVLAGVVVFDFYYLMPWLERRRQRSAEAPAAAGPAAPRPPVDSPAAPAGLPDAGSEDIGATVAATVRARRAKERAVELHRRLEDRGAGVWATEPMEAARAAIARGDESLAAADPDDAGNAYSDALLTLENVEESATAARDSLLAEGQRALEEGDAATADARFRLAGEIDPQNPRVREGLRRVQVHDEVLALLRRGERSERAGRLGEAVEAYERATTLDGDSRAARRAHARARSALEAAAFRDAVSEGLAALARGQHDGAREALRRAAELRPGAAEVAEARAQVDEAERLETIARDRAEAAGLETEELWEDAAERYANVLAIDPTIRFAQQGRTRSEERADLARRIDFHLAHPDRLSTDAVLAEVTGLLDEARRQVPAGPRHRQQVAALDELLAAAALPVPVRLESDGVTDVTVYRVGRLGTFVQHELQLRPGTYTVVGTRRGYRDVRHTLVVVAGTPPAPLLVRCEERI